MTQLEPQTEVLPPRPLQELTQEDNDERSPLRLVLTIVAVLLALVVLVGVIADWIARSEVERIAADQLRTSLGLPESQHIEVDIAGLFIPQYLTGRLSEVTLTSPNLNLDGAAVDIELVGRNIALSEREIDGPLSGTITVGADQASAMLLADGGMGPTRVGFAGADMTMSVDLTAGGQSAALSMSVTPTLEAGRLSVAFSSITLGDQTITADDVAEQLGDDAAQLEPEAVCVAQILPRGFNIDGVGVEDQHLVIRFTAPNGISGGDVAADSGSCA